MSTKPTGVLPLGSTPDGDTFQVESQSPRVGFLKRAVQPPSQVYIETSDVLMVAAATSQFAEMVTVTYRLLRYDGVVIHGQFVVQPSSNRTITTHSEQLAEGFLLSMSCKCAVATTRGMTFVRAFLTKPSLGPGQPSYMLMADYVTNAMAPAYPNGRILDPSEGPGWIHGVSAGTIPVGLDWSIASPSNTRWRLINMTGVLTTAAGGANRTPLLLASVGFGAGFTGQPTAVQVPATAVLYESLPYYVAALSNPAMNFWGIPPDYIIPGGATLGTQTLNIAAGDQWTQAEAIVEDWLDNV